MPAHTGWHADPPRRFRRTPAWRLHGGLAIGSHRGSPAQSRESARPESTQRDARVLDCDTAIGSARRPEGDLTVVLDAVAVPAARADSPALGANPTSGEGEARLFTKRGLVVRRGSAVRLGVPEPAAGRLWIGWGTPGVPGSTARVDGCDASEEWLAFAGGYWVREPGCFPLRISLPDGREQQVLIGVGAPCPGQKPPP